MAGRWLLSAPSFLHTGYCSPVCSACEKWEFSSHLRIHRLEAVDLHQDFVILVIQELADIVMSQLSKRLLKNPCNKLTWEMQM